jgi:hypothetical protein
MTTLDRIESACTMTTEGSILWLRMTVLGSDRWTGVSSSSTSTRTSTSGSTNRCCCSENAPPLREEEKVPVVLLLDWVVFCVVVTKIRRLLLLWLWLLHLGLLLLLVLLIPLLPPQHLLRLPKVLLPLLL